MIAFLQNLGQSSVEALLNLTIGLGRNLGRAAAAGGGITPHRWRGKPPSILQRWTGT